jgi:hypothetical protein
VEVEGVEPSSQKCIAHTSTSTVYLNTLLDKCQAVIIID